MFNRSNTFKKAVQQLTDRDQQPDIALNESTELTDEQKKQLFYQTKMYILLQDMLEKLKPDLHENEEIQGYLPFTNEQNSATATSGIMGMTYVNSPASKEYRDTFYDLRGNRLMIFTNERMIYFVVIEFLENHLFYSYPYEDIQHIRFKEHRNSYSDWHIKAIFKPTKHIFYWYTLDFQANNHVFTEILTAEDAKIFKQQLENIPKLKKIDLSKKVKRNSTFDLLFSNVNWGIRGIQIFFGVLMIIFLIFLILAFFHVGPFTEFIYPSNMGNLLTYWLMHIIS